jgi:methyltransferase
MACLFAGAETLRWWVIRTLGRHWNVQVMNSVRLGIVCSGPFRIVRHPNYLAVFVEMTALPLIHSAWITATVGAAAHLWVLSGRVKLEESVLFADPMYRTAMASTPRFIPRLR